LKRLVAVALLALFVISFLPLSMQASAQATPNVSLKSHFALNRYGFAIINESVKFTNGGTDQVQVPTVTLGFGAMSSKIVNHTLTGTGFVMTAPDSTGPFTISGGTISAGATVGFGLSVLVNGIVSTASNGTMLVQTISWPSLSLNASTFTGSIRVPTSVVFVKPPTGYTAKTAGSNTTYTASKTLLTSGAAVVTTRKVTKVATMDLHPLKVYSVTRDISPGPGGTPYVTDTLTFGNLGITTLSTLYVTALASGNSSVTILESTNPRLISSTKVSLNNGTISLARFAPGYPSGGVGASQNFSISYRYPLQSKDFKVSNGEVDASLPLTPPIKAFIDSYSVTLTVPAGVHVVQGSTVTSKQINPWTRGTTTVSYAVTPGWALNTGVPAASLVFVLLLIGLFVSRGTSIEEVGEEEESSSEKTTAMVTAFDEKTDLINSMWPEVAAKDPNELDKEYFDGLRTRLDAFRSRALQRLNEMKQASTSQKFFDLLNQIHTTEREVDRAAKDKLNLYEQFYMKRMRKETYDRLLPQYTKRLERALNQLTDELHVVQKEAKLL
jgi:hypothetical protein